ncbi:splicing factor Yju2p [Diutina catenulata]
MSERKSINKWYPPDYDPLAESKKKKPKKTSTAVQKIRMMMPFSMRCEACDEFIPARRSFNAKKIDTGERYLDIKIFRFDISCPQCNSTVSLRTSPQTAEMVPAGGGVRNFEPKKRPKRTAEVAENETEQELFERLEREEQDQKKYHELLKKRELNPFWQKEDTGQSGLEKRITDHMRQQELDESLEKNLEKMTRIQGYSGDAEKEALAKIHEKGEAESTTTGSTPLPVPSTIKSKIVVRKRKATSNDPLVDETTKTEPPNDTIPSSSTAGLLAGYDSSDDSS